MLGKTRTAEANLFSCVSACMLFLMQLTSLKKKKPNQKCIQTSFKCGIVLL